MTTPTPTPTLLAWSGGKDCLLALQRLLADPQWQVAGLLTTLNRNYQRVAMHGTPREVLQAQAAALGDVVARHEPLRTLFVEVDGEPVQRVLGQVRPRFEVVAVDAADLDERVARAAGHRFDLAAEIPVHAVLFSPADLDRDVPPEHVLLLVMHHIAADGWSLPPLVADLGRAYTARRDGAAPTFPSLPIRYRDHAVRQRDLLGDPSDPGSRAARLLRHWRASLRGMPTHLPLPRLHGRPAVPRPTADTVVRRLDVDAHARLLALARAHRCTLFMVLQAGLAVVLRRLGAGDDIPLGAPVAGRDEATAADLVGFFVNTLVLRTDLSGDPTVAELLARIRRTDLAAYDHQDLPFELLVDDLRPTRLPAGHPLVQVVLALQNNDQAVPDLPGLEGSVEVVRPGAARFELLVDVTDSHDRDGGPAGVAITVEHQIDVFDREVAGWLADALVGTLTAMAEDPRARIGSLGGPFTPAHPERYDHGARHPERDRPAADGRGTPRTDLERRLAAVWADVLGVARVGVHDDFFDLGGNSLRAIRAAVRLADAEGLPVTAARILACPTVAELARDLDARPAAPHTAPIPRAPRRATPHRGGARSAATRASGEEDGWT